MWRDARRCAEHLDTSEARFLALVKAGKFPKPSYHLGTRSPRWEIAAIDAAMSEVMGRAPKVSTRDAFAELARKIEQEGPRRKPGIRKAPVS